MKINSVRKVSERLHLEVYTQFYQDQVHCLFETRKICDLSLYVLLDLRLVLNIRSVQRTVAES